MTQWRKPPQYWGWDCWAEVRNGECRRNRLSTFEFLGSFLCTVGQRAGHVHCFRSSANQNTGCLFALTFNTLALVQEKTRKGKHVLQGFMTPSVFISKPECGECLWLWVQRRAHNWLCLGSWQAQQTVCCTLWGPRSWTWVWQNILSSGFTQNHLKVRTASCNSSGSLWEVSALLCLDPLVTLSVVETGFIRAHRGTCFRSYFFFFFFLNITAFLY